MKIIRTDNLKTLSVAITVNDDSTEKDIKRADSAKYCKDCKYCLAFPRNNSYGDTDYLCYYNGYFVFNIKKDMRTVKLFTPGGRELQCGYEKR